MPLAERGVIASNKVIPCLRNSGTGSSIALLSIAVHYRIARAFDYSIIVNR